MSWLNATTAEIDYCLRYFYQGMLFTYDSIPGGYDGLFVFPHSPVPKPSEQDIVSHMPEAKLLVAALRAEIAKEDAMTQLYRLQKQLIIIVTAIYHPQTTNFATLRANPDLLAMKDAWLGLP